MKQLKNVFRTPRQRSLVAVGSVLMVVLSLSGAPLAQAQEESCDNCKLLRCLKSTVERKQRLIRVYQELYNLWKPRTKDEHGTPLMVNDLSKYLEPDRSRIYRAALDQLGQYAKIEESRTGAVPAAEGCGYSEREMSASTESFQSCTTTGLDGAMVAQPCKELADLIAAHEGQHIAACRARQGPKSGYWPYSVTLNGKTVTKYFPPKIITPAGLAAEEIAAYEMEITSLKKIIEKLEKKCRKVSFKGVTLDCVVGSGPEKVRIRERLEGSACGDPVKATWMIKQRLFAEAPGMPAMPQNTDEFDIDCVAAGGEIEKHYANVSRNSNGGHWFCVYHETPKPQITIRNFRLTHCEGPREQTVTVDAVIGEKCEESNIPPTQIQYLPHS